MEQKGLKAKPGVYAAVVIVVAFIVAFLLRNQGLVVSDVFLVTAPGAGAIQLDARQILFFVLELLLAVAFAEAVVFFFKTQIELRPKSSERATKGK